MSSKYSIEIEERSRLLHGGQSTSNDQDWNGSNDSRDPYYDDQKAVQTYYLSKQDEHLDALESGISRITEMSKYISSTIDEQTREIDEANEELSIAQRDMDVTTKKIHEFVKRYGGPRWCGAVMCLSIIAFVLFLLVLFT